ncbi:MAG: capsular polysaccharide biosynthesis protein [Alcaligenaceae bacterium]|nr:capsular polysaccharide biosynthesis protein [Alcaligenaceae bacterium]
MLTNNKKILIPSKGMQRTATLAALLDDYILVKKNIFLSGVTVDAVAVWGRKPSAIRATEIAGKLSKPLLFLEDGFLRSVGLGNEPPYSIVLDNAGIYYDAGAASDCERFIQQALSAAQTQRAQALMLQWQQAGVSKYNHLPDYEGALPDNYVLVADQTFGDASIRYGQASADSFMAMLEAALHNHPNCKVVVKIHPDVFAGRKKGNFNLERLRRNPQIVVLAEDVHPVRLIRQSQAVYVVTSQMGFEGLLWGKPVYTFGMPFYAGYGLTHDALPAPERRSKVSLAQLVHGALVCYPRYLHPETGQRCEPEDLLAWMALQRRQRARFNGKAVYAVGFSRWKKPFVREFFSGASVRFVKKQAQVPGQACMAVWGMRLVNAVPAGGLIRIEDGFLRSVGLGADLIRPLSWVIDRQGIYYDATRPSDLETIYQHYNFDSDLCQRAAVLRERIVQANLTKYNVGSGGWQRPAGAVGRMVILVPGQVESDASIKYGSPEIRQNMVLLQAVRKANPKAYILYKPHPDVLAGLRQQGKAEEQATQWCDELITDCAMGALLPVVDEVHVLTSLAGFEALLRGKRVVTYGQPFYAGWGLTQDMYPPERRTRKLSLDELVAGALIVYPTYVSSVTRRFTTPERILDELQMWKERGVSGMPFWRRCLRPVLGAVARLRGKA